MSLLSWLDNRTLFSCQLLLAIVFSTVFLGIRRSHPNLRGSRSIALSFLIGAAGILLLFLRGSIPSLLSTTTGNALVLGSFALQWNAVLRFLEIKRPLYPVLIADTAAMAVIFYFSQIQHHIVPRIIAASIAIAFVRGLICFALLKHARRRPDVRLFGLTMAIFTIMSLVRALIVFRYNAPAYYLPGSPFQTMALAGDLLYLCVVGLFFFTVINGQLLARVKDQSERDPLSGTLNRRGIEDKLAVELNRIARSGQRLSLALIDIDHFKVINDTAGHAAGDKALREVVSAISGQLRAYDLLGRYGGDEFLLILPQTTCADAILVAERIADAVRTFSLTRQGPSLTLSIGLSEAIPGEHSISLLSRCDKALYQAKHAGRNCARAGLHAQESDADPNPQPLLDILLSSSEITSSPQEAALDPSPVRP